MDASQGTARVETRLPVHIGKDAARGLIDYCDAQGFGQFLQVADRNTHPALGESIEQGLKGEGFDVSLKRNAVSPPFTGWLAPPTP